MIGWPNLRISPAPIFSRNRLGVRVRGPTRLQGRAGTERGVGAGSVRDPSAPRRGLVSHVQGAASAQRAGDWRAQSSQEHATWAPRAAQQGWYQARSASASHAGWAWWALGLGPARLDGWYQGLGQAQMGRTGAEWG